MEFPYLSEKIKQGAAFKPIPYCSFPFPIQVFPTPLYSTTLLIERVGNSMYLRCTTSPLFCKRIEIRSKEVTILVEVEDNVEERTVKVNYLSAFFDEFERMMGFLFDGKWELFLPLFAADKEFKELDIRMQWLYDAAMLGTSNGIDRVDSDPRLSNTNQIDHIYHPEPKGEWERAMFINTFQSNPSLMTDDEYQMIFGVER